ncbi:MAG: protease inhibitor I42 family protein [Candidatus Methanomethylophilaceae archaeon]|nr:protease inhibitor I42 family protein [Candidatus Methanomethylophilaceae archaeon]
MSDLKGSVLVGEAFTFDIDPNPTAGFKWEVESDGGLSYESWYAQDENPDLLDGVGGTMTFSVRSDVPGRHPFVLRCIRAPDECVRTFELDLQVRPRCDSVYANTWEGFPLSVPLWKEPGGGWKVSDDDGTGCEIRKDDEERDILRLRGGAPGSYYVVLSGSEGGLVVELRILPVDRRISVKAVAREGVSYAADANTTTGYEWNVVDGGGLMFKDRYVSDPNPGALCGVGGRHVFEMMAESPGTYILRAVYARPWEDYSDDALEIVLEASSRKADAPVRAFCGRSTDIVLDSDEDRGYRWEASASEGLSVTSEYRPRGDRFGTSGERVFHILVTKDGRRAFAAAYLDPDGNPVDEYKVDVEALPAVDTIRGEAFVGKPYVVELKANPTTGFRWSVADDGGLKVDERYVPDSRNKRICGSGGRTVYSLSADSPGEYRFVAQYGRSWESHPIKSIEVVLLVKPKKRLF